MIHYKTLHHGSLFLNYAIPAMATCSQHFWVTNNYSSNKEFLNHVFQFIVDNKITKFLIPYNWIRCLPELNAVDLSQTSLITVQGPTENEMIEIFHRFSPKEVINNFGCTEIGTMFVSITDQSNLEHYNPNRFDHVMSNLEYKIHSNFLQVRYPNCNWQILADCFEQQYRVLWWKGRAVHITVDNQSVDFSVLKSMLEQHYNTIDFSVIPDFEKNKLYLAVYDNKIPVNLDAVNKLIVEKLDKKLQLAQISFVKTQDVMFGMKPSAPLLLYMFRNKEK
jgi:hypothetical protein